MFESNPILFTDVYKTVHIGQYPKGMTKLVSYLTPRMSRVSNKEVVFFGLQYFCKHYLIDLFNREFFEKPKEEAVFKYAASMESLLNERFAGTSHWEALHDLGYLPLEISALPEGTLVPMGVPCIQITNTHPDFAWLVNYIEPLLSCELWHPMACATIGYNYRQITNKYFPDAESARGAISDFSMRGQESLQSAITSSAAFLLSFNKTSTIPAVEFLHKYYGAPIDGIAKGLASTEHSVMCSNFAVDGNEKSMIIRLLREIYPEDNFSMVSDSYDYWNLVDNLLTDPEVKEAVLNHKGFIGIRGDSGDPVEIVTETVYRLWDSYGGTVDQAGLKVLNDHIRVVYGDSITPKRAEQIYSLLRSKGFSPKNVALGMGSYSLQSFEDQPLTRDTFSIAVKSTYCEVNGKPYQIFKNPKTDTGHFKKSHKGMCCVYQSKDGLRCVDGFSPVTLDAVGDENLLTPVFRDGLLVKRQTLKNIRNTLHKGGF